MRISIQVLAFNVLIAREMKEKIAGLAYQNEPFNPSVMQGGFFKWVQTKKGSAVLIAVAGSGKSTTIIQCLPLITDDFENVRAGTFHALGFGALNKVMKFKPNVDGRKLVKLFEKTVPPTTYQVYSGFVPKLVSLAKGQGIGCLVPDTVDNWWDMIRHHDLYIESEEGNTEDGIELARSLLRKSTEVAKEEAWIDFDDQLYLPVLWRLRLWQNDWVFIDEAQDTNPIRRALAKMALRPGGRMVAVGDPNQAIYGFTGASHDAIDLIKAEFNAIELPLTVSYRCPKVAEGLVKDIVPAFSVHESAPEGWAGDLDINEALTELRDTDAILCRNTAPLVELAFALIARKRGCVVLGRDIGQGLVSLIQKQRAKGVDALKDKLDGYLQQQVTAFMAKGEEDKADAITDKVSCILTIIDNLPPKDRTVPRLCTMIENMFSDSSNVLTLCTAHKAKGREWDRVGILCPELMPSKWARQAWQAQQEQNLIYVTKTRFKEKLITLVGDAKSLKKK